MALTNASTQKMRAYLTEIYHIPNYQREYTWEDNELSDFWDDLVFTKDDPDKMSHFFGQIVIHSATDEQKNYIIDGQQRTITSVIFLRALQIFYDDIYKASNNSDADDQRAEIKGFIGKKSLKKGNQLHLILNDIDGDYFRDKIQLGHPQKEKKEKKHSRECMRQAFVFFYNKLEEALAGYADVDDKIACLDDYYGAFIDRFEVLYLAATKEEEAFIIFETLNARGKALETADLLKNYIFRQSKDVSEAQGQWNSMINALGQADPTKYIRHFWNSNHDFEREKTLYRAITKAIKTPKQSKELLEDLKQYAPYYSSISNPEDGNIFEGDKLIDSLKALKVLKGQLFFPVVLAMAQANFSEDDIAIVVSSIECYMLRNFTICGKVANESERFFASTAKAIFDGELTTAVDICTHIKEKIVSDDEFRLAFETWTANKSSKKTVRYIFRRIHQHIDKSNEINVDASEVHIEHIMPIEPIQWAVTEETHELYLWRLGNLMLLSGKFNRDISNKPFAEKKTGYSKSKIEPNKNVCQYTEWGPEQIEARQKLLAEYAIEIWNMK